MARGYGRVHRLPQRLDYTLIPAPLDLTLPLVDEKSPLPAIIVTPSSPRSNTDFSIAFLAPQPKPTVRQRISSFFPSSLPSSPIALPITPTKPSSLALSAHFKARTIVMMLLMFVVLCMHLITHRVAVHRPHMEFEPGLGMGGHSTSEFAAEMNDNPEPGPRFLGSWLEFWEVNDVEQESRDFVVTEPLEKSWVSDDTPQE